VQFFCYWIGDANFFQIEDWKHLSFPVSMPPEEESGRDDLKEEQEQDDEQMQD
jgi:hypothetical protein